MAIGMKGWLALVGASCAAVAMTLLPPQRIELAGADELPEQVRYEAVVSELRRAHAVFQLTRWSDSLSALTVSSDPGSVAVGGPEGDPNALEEWQREATASFAPYRSGNDVRLGAFRQLARERAMQGIRLGAPMLGALTFAGTRSGMPYCLTVRTYAEPITYVGPAEDFGPQGPGPCRLMARYGVPGPRVAEWLDGGAWGFGGRTEPALDVGRLRDHTRAEIPYFGTRRHPLATLDPVVGGCLAGDAADCERAIADPTVATPRGSDMEHLLANTPLSYGDVDWAEEAPFSYLDDSLFADLETAFGQDAFARFWSSDQAVEDAFATAFGVELGEWTRSWVDDEIGISRAGPGLPVRDFFLTIVALSVLAAMASEVAMRRSV